MATKVAVRRVPWLRIRNYSFEKGLMNISSDDPAESSSKMRNPRQLNVIQQQAVEFFSGPCLVLAGAGSGKTRVIINKIAYLIGHCGYHPRRVAAVTFTNKAAREMKERVAQTLGNKETRGLMISTFHTLGLEIIKREYVALGMKANFSLFDAYDQMALLKELTQQWIKEDKILLQQLVARIAHWKNELQDPLTVAAQTEGEPDRLFAHCYALYDAHLKACSVLNFDDLIALPTLLLRNNQQVRERWQHRLGYLLVDDIRIPILANINWLKCLPVIKPVLL